MALTVSFTSAPTSLASQVVLTDTSTGSDGAVTDRQIIITDSANNNVGTFDWPIAQSSITISPFAIDQAVNITVNWNNNVGVPLYTTSELFAAVQYAEQAFYGLTQQQSATTTPNIINDQTYFQNKSTFRTLIDSALQAISEGADIYSAQFCISLYQPFLQNPKLYF